MADTAIAITAGTGTNVDTRTESSNGNHRQVVVLGDPATNAGVASVNASLGLQVYSDTLPDTASGDLATIAAKDFATQTTLAAVLAKLDVNLSTRLASGSTLPVVGNLGAAGGSLTAYQGTSPWLVTMATQSVIASGTVTANAGTNLNTSLLALESGGNLATIAGKDFATQTTLASILGKLDVNLSTRLASGSTLPITGNVGQIGTWLMTLATLPVVANINNSSIPVTQSGTWTVQPGNTANTTPWLMTMGTLSIIGSMAGQATVTAIQGDAGSQAWLMTMATLPVVASGTVTANAGTNLNTSLLALESGGNLASILSRLNVNLDTRLASGSTLPITGTITANAGTNLNTSLLALESGGNLASILGKLDVNLSTRLASGSTLPITGTVGALAAGGSLTAYQGGGAWLATLATLPVIASIPGTHTTGVYLWEAQ